MANAICHDEYCEPTRNNKESYNMDFNNKMMIIGGFLLIAIVIGTSLWYGVSQGVYVDPTTYTS